MDKGEARMPHLFCFSEQQLPDENKGSTDYS